VASSLPSKFVNAAKALLGIPALTEQQEPIYNIDEESVKKIRAALGGQLAPLTATKLDWYLSDLKVARERADLGDLSAVAQLARAMRSDGVINGLLDTRTAGLMALPKRFRGREDIITALKAENATRSVFDEMFPASELALLAADGIVSGIGIAEMVPVIGRDHPIMIRHDPQFLRYRWNEGRWYFSSVAGPLPIAPGNGRWILHTPGGRQAPWQHGLVWPLGRSYIIKEHALLHRSNFSGKLANPARVAYTTQASSEAQRLGFLARLIAWGVNTVFELPPGWEAKLLESNGRGWEVFGEEIENSDHESMIAIAGQVVTVTGGTGFANADIHQTIRADLIKRTADALSYTINTQGLPAWVYEKFGADALAETARVEWDIAPPEDRKAAADALVGAANAIDRLASVLAKAGQKLDVEELVNRFGIPVASGAPDEAFMPQPVELPNEKGNDNDARDAA
jgi:phage gp29-like protein